MHDVNTRVTGIPDLTVAFISALEPKQVPLSRPKMCCSMQNGYEVYTTTYA
jgi:hypothetical protein